MWFFKRKKKETEIPSEEKTEIKNEPEQKEVAEEENVEDTPKTSEKKQKLSQQKEKTKVTKKPIYRVMYDKEARVWVIKKDGAKRTIASYPTKEEALNRVKALSTTKDIGYIVHKKDGKFQKK